MATLEEVLTALAREGALYEALPESRVRCYACGHRCLILAGQRGVCKVRWNEGGRLMVPWGYVAGLQLDPVEKKPFFHVYPGARALSFGMLGCDLHCTYCTVGRTLVATSRGPAPIGALFDSALEIPGQDPGAIRASPDLEVYTHAGRPRRVKALFRHRYRGTMVKLQPACLPALHLTPDHEVLAIDAASAEREPQYVSARDLTTRHHVAIPGEFEFSRPAAFDVADGGPSVAPPSRRGRNLGAGLLGPRRRPEIPRRLRLDEKLAALLGYYAAGGRVLRRGGCGQRPRLLFALGGHERARAARIRRLLAEVFGVEARLSHRPSTRVVGAGEASVALFFERLCGAGSRSKRLPPELFEAPRGVVQAFLDAYVEADGCRREAGRVAVAAGSRRLAQGIAWLVLKTGSFPAMRLERRSGPGAIRGWSVDRAPRAYVVDWFEDAARRRRLRRDGRYFYVPLRRIGAYAYDGFVYNMEVEDDRSYLAQFIATHNCQNFVTSQALRDPVAGAPPQAVTPQQIVDVARRRGARILTSTYNEPLITSEWAVEVFGAAKSGGLTCSYVSNGNATPEVLAYLRPWVDLYKVDLKSFDDRHYRRLGGRLAPVLESIARIHELGFWLEVVTLVVPAFNDSDAELRDIARFLRQLSPDIPWHVTAFHPDYRMTDRDDTPAATLVRAAEIGRAEGLRYVYAGNLPGRVGGFENTYCPSCGALLIERRGYRILADRLTPTAGACPACAARIPGVWR